jgi:hypothetical protein
MEIVGDVNLGNRSLRILCHDEDIVGRVFSQFAPLNDAVEFAKWKSLARVTLGRKSIEDESN